MTVHISNTDQSSVSPVRDKAISEAVSRYIKLVRLGKPMSQCQLAKAARISRTCIWRFENCDRKTTITTLIAMSEALEVPIFCPEVYELLNSEIP